MRTARARQLDGAEQVSAFHLWKSGLDTLQIADIMTLKGERPVSEASVYNALHRLSEAMQKRFLPKAH